ncbi:DUF2492 family protein [Escherichia coli]|nr:DUF2492 family protein [Escherichia coli]
MDSIHGHEVLNMMIESGEQYTHASLEAAIIPSEEGFSTDQSKICRH